MFTLDRMEIHGFKSFFVRTAFEFKPGIIAVVGPNGCGKSNIGDAISWVLGDQSPRSLRADRMADVIFNGSQTRKPLGMAEVTLKFMKTNGGPEPSEEFVVTRRLYRDGNSEYCLNGVRCRLRDIQDMLIRSQVGSRLYSVIEQGKVDLILTSKPKDRRALFEEAAGVLGYKAKRRVALGKLEATQDNLLRIHDILTEVTKQTSSLRRQVARARRYQRLQQTIRSRRGVLLCSRLEELERDAQRALDARRALTDQEAQQSTLLSKSGAEVEQLRRHFEEADEAIRRGRERQHELIRALDRDRMQQQRWGEEKEESLRAILRWSGEATQLHAKVTEKETDLAQRASQAEASQLALQNLEQTLQAREDGQRRRVESVERFEQDSEATRSELLAILDRQAEERSRRESIERELKRLEARLQELAVELAEAAREHEGKRVELDEMSVMVASSTSRWELARREREVSEQALAAEQAALQNLSLNRETLAGTIAQIEERLRALEEAELSDGDDGRARQSILALASEGRMKTRGRAADALEVEPRWLAAAEAALGDLLGAVVVEGPSDILEAVRHLREGGRGRCGFLSAGRSKSPLNAVPPELLSDSRCMGPLAEKVALKGELGEALRCALAPILVAQSLTDALELHEHYPHWSYVTVDGDLVHSAGLVQGGAAPPDGKGILTRRHLRESLSQKLSAAREERDRLDGERESREANRRLQAERTALLEEKLRERDREVVESRLRLAQLEEEVQRAQRTLRIASEEQESVNGQARDQAAEISSLLEAQSATAARRKELEDRIAAGTGVLASRREEMTAEAESLGAFRSEVASRREAISKEAEALASWKQAAAEERGRWERARNEAGTATARVQSLEASLNTLAVALGGAEKERAELASRLESMELAAATQKSELLLAEQREKAARTALDELRGRSSLAEVEVARLDVEHKHLEASTREEMSLTLDALRALPLPEGEFSAAAIESEITDLKGRLERLGAVNLAALEQYQEMEQRHEFLAKQKKDLEDSIESLNDTIRKINRTSREKFLEAFEKIQEGFNKSFVTLFGGGRAELRLMEDEDVLECGIEIIASPPGKRLQNISLLSGGEKAMTAVALLFALFRYRPSPFCVLDEVDAPLDEANVGRFTRMLRELTPETQFILITHNRRSMEAADLLYGITMEEPGISSVVSMRLDN
ncbi:MAG: chromosome segregation protein SMC [Acidobacteria bacterium]|nr:chromosome segregation protein SMC [Acidobacteriota bacterium]